MRPESHPFFEGIPQDSVRRLLANASTQEFAQGEVIFDAGAPADALYLLCSGRVRYVTRTGGGDRLLTVGEAEAGAIFGEMGILTDSPRATRALAMNDVVVLRISAEPLREAWGESPVLARKLGSAIAAHLRETTQSLSLSAGRQDRLATLGTMVGSMAHDFRTPLTLINLNAQLVETVASTREPEFAALLLKHCRNIEVQVERMMGMIEEVSDYASGRVNDDYSKIKLRELFDSYRFLNSALWENTGVDVSFTADDVSVVGAPRKLLRVLQNLIGNAVDALSEQDNARIVVDARAVGKDAVITVTDNGPGIPAHIRDTFWEPFVTSGKARGTGLGTSICRSLVESHGGAIRFETESGKGTTFIITLPQKQPKSRAVAK